MVAAIVVALAVLGLTWDPKLHINGDNVDYMNLARAVRDGDLWPSEKYPPLFPLLLAPVQALFGPRLGPQKGLVLLFAGAAVLLGAALLRRRQTAAVRPWLLLAMFLAVPPLEYAHYVMSEVPFLCLLLAALVIADRLAGRPAQRGWREAVADPRIWGLALCLMAAFYLRSAGVAAVLGLLAWLAVSRRFQDAAVLLAACAVLCVPWFLAAAHAPGGHPYLRQLLFVNPYYPELGSLGPGTLAQRLADNARGYLLDLAPHLAFPLLYSSTYSPPEVQRTFAPVWLSVLLGVPLAAGWVRGVIRRDVPAFVLGASLLVLLLWPAIWTSTRFLVPLVPLLILAWWDGWQWPLRRAAPRAWPRLRGVVLALIVLLTARNLVFYAQESREYPPAWKHYFELLEVARQRLPADAVIADRKPGFVAWVAQRRAVPAPRESDPERMLMALRRAGATHVILAPLPYDDINRYVRPALEGAPAAYRPIHATGEPAAFLLEIAPSVDPELNPRSAP